MLRLVQTIDQALGYVAPTTYLAPSHSPSHSHSHAHAHTHAQDQQPRPTPLDALSYTSTVQEKWIDYPEEHAAFEREGWKKEGELAMERANVASVAAAAADRELELEEG